MRFITLNFVYYINESPPMTKLTDDELEVIGRSCNILGWYQFDHCKLTRHIQAQADDIKELREALTEARTWVSGWASANYELGVIDKALAATEAKSDD